MSPPTITAHEAEEVLAPSVIEALEGLLRLCFDPEPDLSLADLVRSKSRPLALLAWSDALAVGFKLGYERSRREHYSWLGGVHPGHRRRGTARALLEAQHARCRSAGYQRVTTEALHDNASMLRLNLGQGFVIVGTRLDPRGLKVLMECDLARG